MNFYNDLNRFNAALAATLLLASALLVSAACSDDAGSSSSPSTATDMRPAVSQDMMASPLDLGAGALDMDARDVGSAPDAMMAQDQPADLPEVLEPRPVDRSDILSMDREVPVYLPEDYDNTTRIPLIIALHGFATSGSYLNNYLDLEQLVASRDVAMLIPEGRRNLTLSKYWAATDACCSYQSLASLEDDDVLFLRDVITQARARYAISKVYVIGHSNGGYMSYRMACDAADLVDGIMSLAGATFDDVARCAPSRPVKILQVHGTSDAIVPFGGSSLRDIPGAETTIASWSNYNRCTQGPTMREDALDLVSGDSPETDVLDYSGCADDASVTLWRIQGSGHNPALRDDFMVRVLDHLAP